MTEQQLVESDEEMRENRDKFLAGSLAMPAERERKKRETLREQAEMLRKSMDADTKNMIRELRWVALNELQARLNDGRLSNRLLVELACHLK